MFKVCYETSLRNKHGLLGFRNERLGCPQYFESMQEGKPQNFDRRTTATALFASKPAQLCSNFKDKIIFPCFHF
jgi:hypothetical protein